MGQIKTVWCEEAHLVISVLWGLTGRKRRGRALGGVCREPKRVVRRHKSLIAEISKEKLVGKEIFLPDWEAFVTLLTTQVKGEGDFFSKNMKLFCQ